MNDDRLVRLKATLDLLTDRELAFGSPPAVGNAECPECEGIGSEGPNMHEPLGWTCHVCGGTGESTLAAPLEPGDEPEPTVPKHQPAPVSPDPAEPWRWNDTIDANILCATCDGKDSTDPECDECGGSGINAHLAVFANGTELTIVRHTPPVTP